MTSARRLASSPHVVLMHAALVYLGVRLFSWLLLAQAAHEQVWNPYVTGPREGHIDLALSWDAQWYRRIAEDGYPADLPVGDDGHVQQNPWAFYPLFPYACRLVMTLTGAEFSTVAPWLALVAGLAAAVLMAHLFRIALPRVPSGAVVGAVACWAAWPASPVLQMAYTESFSMVLLVAYLLLVVRQQWWWAGGCALLLGVTRPIALPLLLVSLAAAWMVWRGGRDDEHPYGRFPRAARHRWGLVWLVGATGASGALWPALAWLGTGRSDAYTATMSAWRGAGAINVVEPWLNTARWARDYHDKAAVVPTISIVVALALGLLMVVPRFAGAIDLRLRVWTAAYAVYLLAVVDGTTSIVRYLTPLFPVALVLVGLHRAGRSGQGSRWWRWRSLAWVVAGCIGQIGWIWWLVLFSPPSDFPP